jgi:hypothetical protein
MTLDVHTLFLVTIYVVLGLLHYGASRCVLVGLRPFDPTCLDLAIRKVRRGS